MTHAQDVIRENKQAPTLNARMGTGGNQVPILLSAGFKGEQSASARGLGYKEEQCPTLTTATPPDVMTMENIPNVAMSTTVGRVAYAIGNGQADQLQMSAKVGALNCMHDQIAVMQKLVTENKQLEACAPMTDEDSTDKT